MTNTKMKSGRHVKMQPGVVVHLDIAKVNKLSLRKANYFGIFIDEASGFERSINIKSKYKAAKSLKKHELWTEQQTDT